MKQNSFKIKIIAGILIGMECVILTTALGFVVYSRYKNYAPGASITRIDHNKVEFKPSVTLTGYYEWKPNQLIEYENAWQQIKPLRRSNSDGLAEDVERSPDKDPKIFRIIALGDSFTEGPYVRYEDTYPVKLEHILNTTTLCDNAKRYEVINFGNWGYDIEFASHRLLTKGIKYKPDLVLWLVKDDDFYEINELLVKKIDQYTASLTETEKADITKFAKYDLVDDDLKNSHAGTQDVLRNVASKEILNEISPEKYFSIQTRAVINTASSVQVPIVLITFQSTDSKYKARMKVWSKSEKNLRVFDEMENLADDETFKPFDWHPNEKGYLKIAENIFRYLSESGSLCHE